MPKEEIAVVCAVVRKGDRYLAVQRSQTMREALLWEFPGGKIEAGETMLDALHREIDEELHATVSVHGILRPSYQQQERRRIVLHPILCRLTTTDFHLREHRAFEWISSREFGRLAWCPADLDILRNLQNPLLESSGWWL